MKRYAWLLAVGVVLSLGALVVGRTVRLPGPAPDAAPELPAVGLEIAIGDSGVTPAAAAVPKDHRVVLTVRNDRATAATLALQGYEDRLSTGPIAPGATVREEFVADRPGEAFEWIVDGAPVGRLSVTGSHLVEGHR